MANKTLFQTFAGAILSRTDARNEAGGPADALPPRHALAPCDLTAWYLDTPGQSIAEGQLIQRVVWPVSFRRMQSGWCIRPRR